jgi:Protein of unknown function (DUF3309)
LPAFEADDRGFEPPAQSQQRAGQTGRREMSIGTILLIILVLILIGAIPAWPYSQGWGYAPSGILGLVLVVVVILLLLGKL